MAMYERDLDSLLTEARQDPSIADDIITALLARVRDVQRDADALRAENALLRRGSAQALLEQVERLRSALRDVRGWAPVRALHSRELAVVSFTGDALMAPLASVSRADARIRAPGGGSARDLRPVYVCEVGRMGQLVAVSSSFHAALVECLSIDSAPSWDWALARPVAGAVRSGAARIEAIAPTDEIDRRALVVLLTRGGWVKVLPWTTVDNLIGAGQPLFRPSERHDTPAWISGCDRGDVIVFSRSGRWTRFPIDSVETAGAEAFTLEAGDEAVCAALVDAADSHVCVVADTGAVIVASAEAFVPHRKPGSKPAGLPRGFRPVAAAACTPEAAIVALSLDGEWSITPVSKLPVSRAPTDPSPYNPIGRRLSAAVVVR